MPSVMLPSADGGVQTTVLNSRHGVPTPHVECCFSSRSALHLLPFMRSVSPGDVTPKGNAKASPLSLQTALPHAVNDVTPYAHIDASIRAWR
ncbi:hypothetical protein AMTR_s00014p00200370 [Amborella trichopoda]|uniref:Uncharacterized protein n=1 Tax=Amborella trichopoda TaxID=13333 RepID=W1PN59_AMBTC|nr:hypothetical protein AMTR_s00014p00200370 [Amborella trichopoda]